MREITHHKTNGCNESLTIRVLDEPGSGGASHHYAITTPNKPLKAELASPAVNCEIMFQNGPVAEAGVNGVTQEALLAIVIDRLESFQKGHHSCRENACALTKLQEAMHWLQHRTNARVARGVEGTHTV